MWQHNDGVYTRASPASLFPVQVNDASTSVNSNVWDSTAAIIAIANRCPSQDEQVILVAVQNTCKTTPSSSVGPHTATPCIPVPLSESPPAQSITDSRIAEVTLTVSDAHHSVPMRNQRRGTETTLAAEDDSERRADSDQPDAPPSETNVNQ